MKRAFYTIATASYEPHFENLRKSLRKFDKETDFIRFSDNEINLSRDPQIFYRATPYFAKKLFEQGYDEVCHLDSDQVIIGSLDDIWTGDYDVATVLNDPTYPLQVWDIKPYYNNGLNVFKSKPFVDHLLRLCYSDHFNPYQFKEQDLLNILCSDYNNYKVRCLDLEDKVYGEFAKPLWATSTIKDSKVMVGDKQLCVIHYGGGHGAPKGNYRTRFPEEVITYIEEVLK